MKGSKRGALRPFRAHQGRRNTLRHSGQLKHVTVRVFEINAFPPSILPRVESKPDNADERPRGSMLRQVIIVQPGHNDILLLLRKFSECSAGNFTQMNDPAVPVWLLCLSEEQQLSD